MDGWDRYLLLGYLSRYTRLPGLEGYIPGRLRRKEGRVVRKRYVSITCRIEKAIRAVVRFFR